MIEINWDLVKDYGDGIYIRDKFHEHISLEELIEVAKEHLKVTDLSKIGVGTYENEIYTCNCCPPEYEGSYIIVYLKEK